MSIGVIIGVVVFVLIWVWLVWEAINSPIMPDDYDIRRSSRNTQEAPPTNEKSPPSSQTYSGTNQYEWNTKHWKYATTDCLCQMKKVDKHTKDCVMATKARTLNELRQSKTYGYRPPSPSKEKS